MSEANNFSKISSKERFRIIVLRYRKADKFWLFIAGLVMFVALLVPNGAIGIILFLTAKEYLSWAEGE